MVFNVIAEISRIDLQELKKSPPPGSAPKGPRQLKKDSGLICIAQNAAQHPGSPLETLFGALYIAHPSFDIRSTMVQR
jgi:hypothetical protein